MPRKDRKLSAFERHLGPAQEWAGNCFGVATQAVEKKLVPEGSVAVYGHWKGFIHPKSLFAVKARAFSQHGWVQQPDGFVCDPTRWVFEHVAPYIYIGPADHYDEGGNTLRMKLLGAAPEYDPTEMQFELTEKILPSPSARAFIERRLGSYDAKPGVISVRQLMWLANHDPAILGEHAGALYAAVDALGQRVLVPQDNWALVKRRAPELARGRR